jgi:hypothetical protein
MTTPQHSPDAAQTLFEQTTEQSPHLDVRLNTVFNHATVSLKLKETAQVTLSLCDETGKPYINLVQGLFLPGSYSFDTPVAFLRHALARDGNCWFRLAAGRTTRLMPMHLL